MMPCRAGIDDPACLLHSPLVPVPPARRRRERPRPRLAAAGGLIALLAVAPAEAGEPVRLAPALPRTEQPAAPPPEAVIREESWRLCKVRTTVLLNMPERSVKVAHDERLLALGESVDLERDVPITSGSLAALVRFRVRVRAALARSPGAIYHVTTEALLASAVGYDSDEVGQSQIRHAMLDINGPGARLHEAYVSPELRARLVVAVEAEPVLGRAEPDPMQLLSPQAAEIHRFKVEAFLKEGEVLAPIDQMTLAALEGQDAVYAMSRFSAEPVAAKERPLGSASVADVDFVEGSGFEKDHVVPRTAPVRAPVRDSPQPDSSFIDEHAVEPHRDGPQGNHVIKGKNPKLSKKKRAKIIEQQQIQAVRDFAIERSKTLPSGDAVPEGFDRTWFEVHVTPLHVTPSVVQAELRIEGRLKLPREEAITTIATKVIEHLPRGESFEIAVSELVRERASDYDYVIRITPEP